MRRPLGLSLVAATALVAFVTNACDAPIGASDAPASTTSPPDADADVPAERAPSDAAPIDAGEPSDGGLPDGTAPPGPPCDFVAFGQRKVNEPDWSVASTNGELHMSGITPTQYTRRSVDARLGLANGDFVATVRFTSMAGPVVATFDVGTRQVDDPKFAPALITMSASLTRSADGAMTARVRCMASPGSDEVALPLAALPVAARASRVGDDAKVELLDGMGAVLATRSCTVVPGPATFFLQASAEKQSAPVAIAAGFDDFELASPTGAVACADAFSVSKVY